MGSDILSRVWAAHAQALAERGVIECRVCRRHEDLAGALQLWRHGELVYALCERCAGSHDLLITPTKRGVEVRGKRRRPYVIVPAPGGAA